MLACAAFVAPAGAATLEEAYAGALRDTLALLETRAAALAGTAAICPMDVNGLAARHEAYHGALDAWMTLQPVALAPMREDNRAARLHFWPDPRNNLGRGLARLIEAKDPASTDPAAIAAMSVALQGFPALERLWFDPANGSAGMGPDEDALYRCRLAAGIAEGIAANARALAEAFAADPGLGEGPEGQTRLALNAAQSGIQLIAFRKLGGGLGDSVEKARPKRLEDWRSDRPFRNVAANLVGLDAFWRAGGEGGLAARLARTDPVLADKVAMAFDAALGAGLDAAELRARSILNRDRRPLAYALVDAVARLNDLLSQDVPAALGIHAGFNALDGD